MTGAGRLTRAVRGACIPWQLSRLGRRTCPLTNQLRASGNVAAVEQLLHRYGYERRVSHVAIAVGIHEPAGLREQEPGLRILRAALRDVRVIEHHEHLQQIQSARGRRRHTYRMLAIGATERLAPFGAVVREILQGHRAGARLLVRTSDDLLRNRARVQSARPFDRQALQGTGIRQDCGTHRPACSSEPSGRLKKARTCGVSGSGE